ncbi:peptide-methionine (R)-S-oxide reductase MsrB [Flavobacterium sp. W1B]|uniref:peptide-methionine (R)-S-oxide reductase MsrB n=1 Tax=Flavobacterium sp. W1B TaxID=3394146 RepID=UPI0039BD534A
MEYPLQKAEEQWKEQLGEERYRILRQKGTEYPHSGKYNLTFETGTYCCGGCGEPLFESSSKFEAHCGWPSFDDAIPEKVKNVLDKTHGMIRTEIVCANCGGHLGHVFNDGPTKSGQRYCVNSLSVDFKEE